VFVRTVLAQRTVTLRVCLAYRPVGIQAEAKLVPQEAVEAEVEGRVGRWLQDAIGERLLMLRLRLDVDGHDAARTRFQISKERLLKLAAWEEGVS